jgi:hypothetical protein
VTSCSALVSPLLAVASCMSSVSTFPASYSSPPVVLGSSGRPFERFSVCRCSSGDRPGVEVIKLEGIGLDSQVFDHLGLGHSNDLGVEGCFGGLKSRGRQSMTALVRSSRSSLGYAYPSIDIVVLAGDLLLNSMRKLCSV